MRSARQPCAIARAERLKFKDKRVPGKAENRVRKRGGRIRILARGESVSRPFSAGSAGLRAPLRAPAKSGPVGRIVNDDSTLV
jgi:hypothetical protein